MEKILAKREPNESKPSEREIVSGNILIAWILFL